MRSLASSLPRDAIRRHARALILLLAASAVPFAQTAPPADQNSASVEGVVLNALTGDPFPRAHVTLFHFTVGSAPRRYGAMTTAEGKFSITGLPEGSYSISANRLGFFFKGRGPNGFTLKSGDRKDDVTLTLTPTGAISGTVVDADGEPVENCSVVAESGRGGQGSTSDAQGRFRIGGLAPGKYRLKATPDEPQIPPEIRTDGTAEVHYTATYYPSALDAASATTIDLAPGAEADSNEVRLVRTPIVRVSGKVTGIPQGAENVMLTFGRPPTRNHGLGWRFNTNGAWSNAQVKKDGTFDLWRLAPGPYRISAQWNSPTGQSAAAPPVEVVVGDSNIDGIELRMIPAADIAGQVQYEDDAARPPAPAGQTTPARRNVPQVFLQGIDGTGGSAFGQVDETGAFTIRRVMPGRYRVRWNGGEGYVKSMLLGSTEIAGDILDLSGGAAGAALTILISTQFGSVSGTVQSDGASAAGLSVVLLPDSEESGGGMGFQVATRVGADGSYSFGSVIPGTYKLAAMAKDDFSALMQGEQDWEVYAPVIETVTVAAGEKATQDLKLLKPQ